MTCSSKVKHTQTDLLRPVRRGTGGMHDEVKNEAKEDSDGDQQTEAVLATAQV